MIDSHCHIGFDLLKENTETLINHAAEQGVEKMLTVACGQEDLPDLYSVLDRYEGVYGAFGIHPSEIKEPITEAALKQIILSHSKIKAVGETGLDYYYNDTPHEVQINNFLTHIRVAKELDLPIIIHTRAADTDTIRILTEQADARLRGVLHCFTGSFELAEAALNCGFYLSASGVITFKITQKNEAYQTELLDIFKKTPANRLLIETDSPYLAPVPMRGQRNEPAYLPYTLNKLAELKNMRPADLEKITTDNFNNLFLKGKNK
ncbi:MAG: TatD family hydrolase [Alphaproteobacteria bacterium]